MVSASWLATYPVNSFRRIREGHDILGTLTTGRRYLGDNICWVVPFDRFNKGMSGVFSAWLSLRRCQTNFYICHSIRGPLYTHTRSSLWSSGLENGHPATRSISETRGSVRMEVSGYHIVRCNMWLTYTILSSWAFMKGYIQSLQLWNTMPLIAIPQFDIE